MIINKYKISVFVLILSIGILVDTQASNATTFKTVGTGVQIGHPEGVIIDAADENLLYGLITQASNNGSVILIEQVQGAPYSTIFDVNYAGDIITAGSITSAGQAVCLQNGTGCPAVATPTLQSVTDQGNTTTNNVGIGVTPTAKLHVVASTDIEAIRVVSSNYSPFVIRNIVDDEDLARIDQYGNLTVAGGVRLGNKITAELPNCVAGILGTMIFDTTEDKPYVCASTGWKPLDSDYDKDGIVDWNDQDDTNASLKHVNLIGPNILSGVDIFGVTGTSQTSPGCGLGASPADGPNYTDFCDNDHDGIIDEQIRTNEIITVTFPKCADVGYSGANYILAFEETADDYCADVYGPGSALVTGTMTYTGLGGNLTCDFSVPDDFCCYESSNIWQSFPNSAGDLGIIRDGAFAIYSMDCRVGTLNYRYD